MMRANWTRQELYILDGTFLELHPEAGSGYWLVVDVRRDIRVAGPFERLQAAKVSAEGHARREPGYRKPR